MRLNVQKRLAASVLRTSRKKIRLDTERMDDIKESITKADIKALISEKAIVARPKRGISRARVSRKKRGPGSRKGKEGARSPRKKAWVNHVRLQRKMLRELKDREMLSKDAFRELYLKSKGGFFRSKRHLRLYIQEHAMLILEKRK